MDWRAENILIGCTGILGQCNQTVGGWMDGKPYRRAVLGRIKQSWATRDGKRALRDLMRFTESAVEAATWVDEFWVGALPTGREPKRLSESHKHALHAGRDRAQKSRLQKNAGEYTDSFVAAKTAL